MLVERCARIGASVDRTQRLPPQYNGFSAFLVVPPLPRAIVKHLRRSDIVAQARIDVDALVAEIMQSPKYKDTPIAPATIRDLVLMEQGHYKKEKDLVKAVRKKLHRIVAAYLGDPDYTAATLELTQATQSGNAEQLRSVCARLLE